ALVTAAVGSYRPNAWGLFDMHGNVGEWTRSLYSEYPYVAADRSDDPAADGERVVRGGSWYARPKDAVSSFRWKYAPWRKVFNVGFRVVVQTRPSSPTPATSSKAAGSATPGR
ncbi:MAG: SUMF1/EgtB/PvdO family nonheme iron enzyme, partial [Planctomycetes bacterium]|nr:SUMF1/EgtB/PvdO family nonheme iron enzyme [Planctomycetota bacterium]